MTERSHIETAGDVPVQGIRRLGEFLPKIFRNTALATLLATSVVSPRPAESEQIASSLAFAEAHATPGSRVNVLYDAGTQISDSYNLLIIDQLTKEIAQSYNLMADCQTINRAGGRFSCSFVTPSKWGEVRYRIAMGASNPSPSGTTVKYFGNNFRGEVWDGQTFVEQSKNTLTSAHKISIALAYGPTKKSLD